jgi:predicted HAD superfamily phosphohydrolase YqeG
MMARMKDLNIATHTNTKLLEISLPRIKAAKDGKESVFGDFDNVIVAAGRHSNNKEAEKWRSEFPDKLIIAVGDAVTPGLAIDALHSAMEEANHLLAVSC